MRDETVSRNYADTLFALGMKANAIDEYGKGLGTVARLAEANPKSRLFLETPRIRQLRLVLLEQLGRLGARPGR